ncbi:TonB-dependent hemoglobin/transferrin/lactoferrin family receptor [Pseudomonas sp. ABC1]|uniref:TonB-dependent receptor n=1 Tax=Pseudomonas sp. ABC1 TaxID=2748080 RepID=UPI00358E37EE
MNIGVLARAVGLGILATCAASTGMAQAATPQMASEASGNALASTRSFDIPAQPLREALLRFASQAGIDLLVGEVELNGLESAPLQGQYSIEQGLRRLLSGTGIGYSQQQTGKRPSVQLFNLTSTSEQAIHLGHIDIQSDSPNDWVYKTPRSVSVIDREQLERRPARHAADMLEQTTGVYSAVSQQDPALSVNIRGIQDYGRVNMNIDGMRQNFQKSGHGQRNGTMYIDPELLSGVTVNKGPSSGVGGAGAEGGITTFSTYDAREFLEPGKEIGGRLSATSGDNGTHFIGSGMLAIGNDLGDILLGASERHLGNYQPGQHGDISGIRISDLMSDAARAQFLDRVKSEVLYSEYTMRSRMAKFGLNLPGDQRVQLSYLQTQVSSPNAGTLGNTDPAWSYAGKSNVLSRNLALDYSLQPQDNDWLDLKAKLYHVDTDDDSDVVSRTLSYQIDTRVQTYGLQLDNTSQLLSTLDGHQLSANYGLDIFHDKASSDSTREVASSVTPTGKRTMSSLFASLDYGYDDWLTLQAGLRYDRYRLRGITGLTVKRLPFTIDNPCTETRISRCPGTIRSWQEYDVDREAGKLSPTLAIAIKPGLDWLELFANYGKAWRPAATTETLAMGSAHTSDSVYPNPFLDPERSRSWEVGMNTLHNGLLFSEDRLGAKLAWFDSKIDNYIYQAIGRGLPGYSPVANMGDTAYVNNLATMRFRGLEFQLDYDAGFAYTSLSWTRMIGENDFCSVVRYLGGQVTVGGSAGNYYEEPVDSANYSNCQMAQAFTSTQQRPGDRGSLTLGGRAFDRRLDAGVIVRYTPGYQSDLKTNNYGGYIQNIYDADWAAYTLYDLYASFKVSDSLTLRGSVENLTNVAYVTQYGDYLSYTLGRGRTVQGTVEYRF